MPTRWATFMTSHKGGLVTNLGGFNQATELPGSARVLENFEPSIEGGYKRLEGYTKFHDDFVPLNGIAKLAQDYTSPTNSFEVVGLYEEPEIGQSFTLPGSATVYTITGVTYTAIKRGAVLSFSPAMDVDNSRGDLLTFNNSHGPLVKGIFRLGLETIAVRNNAIYVNSGSGWTPLNNPVRGTVTVDGAGQTGSSLNVTGLTSEPRDGDMIQVDGNYYTVVGNTSVTSGDATLSLSNSIAVAPANGASVSFLHADVSTAQKVRFISYNMSGTETAMMVTGMTSPLTYDGTSLRTISVPSDVDNADFVAEFKNSIFLAKDNKLAFTAPLTDDDFDPANGAGVITLTDEVTGLFVFRENLFIFCREKIFRLTGSSAADFEISNVSQRIGCIKEDTISEVGGDVAFLSVDGVRTLSSTDRIGDFQFGVTSKKIQNYAEDFYQTSDQMQSVIIRGKNQYRLFGFNPVRTDDAVKALLGVQFASQNPDSYEWSVIRGINVYSAHTYYDTVILSDVALFANGDGYVYRMDFGNTFDGRSIRALLYTPFYPMEDPEVRKGYYKLKTYFEPEGIIRGKAKLKFDYGDTSIAQPDEITLPELSSGGGIWGFFVWGERTWGSGGTSKVSDINVVGSSFNVSVEYEFDYIGPSFSLDNTSIEYNINDRR